LRDIKIKTSIFGKSAWFAARNWKVTLIFWLIILLFGYLSYSNFLKREGFPQITTPFAALNGTYFVEDDEKVNNDVVIPITNQLSKIEQIKDFTATSSDNFYNVIIEFQSEIGSDEGAKLVENAIKDVKLPNGATKTTSTFDISKFAGEFDIMLAVYNSNKTYSEVQATADRIIPILESRDEIKTAETVPVFETVTNPTTGQKHEEQISINKVAVIDRDDIQFQPAISVGLTSEDLVDDITLSNAVQEIVDEISTDPEYEDVNLIITADFAPIINQQISSLESNLLTGLIAVLILALFLISWRAALVIALFIPTVLASSFLGLHILGYTINVITLFSLILTLGLFVDDATIIVEAIDVRSHDKKTKEETIKKSVSRIGLASLAGTLTTLIVFTPMLYISGILGEFIHLIPITVILALSVSFIISILLVPFLSKPLVLGKKGKITSIFDKFSILNRVEIALSKILAKIPLSVKTVNIKGWVLAGVLIGISFSFIIASFIFASKLKFEIFPTGKDGNEISVNIEFPPQTTIQQAEAITNQVDESIIRIVDDELEYASYFLADTRSAILQIGLTNYSERDISAPDITKTLQEDSKNIHGARIKYIVAGAGPPFEEYPFQVRLHSENFDNLIPLATEIQTELKDKILVESKRGVSELSILDVKVEGQKQIMSSKKGRFILVSAKFSDEEQNSAGYSLTKEYLQNDYSQTLEQFGFDQSVFDFDVSSESKNQESFGSIVFGLFVALGLMYLLLAILFKSLVQPILIFLAIVFSFFGVFFGLYVTDNPMSFFVMLGILGLFGIVVNNTILITEYAKPRKKRRCRPTYSHF